MPDSFLKKWFRHSTVPAGTDRVSYLVENTEVDAALWPEATAQLRDHYVTPERLAHLCETLGNTAASRALRARMPTSKTARSGELGEILATEYLNDQPGPHVMVKRLRWKDGRNAALRGDDIFACALETSDSLRIIKGECKSAQSLSQATLDAAVEKLRENDGRPSEHTASFIADRLSETNEPLADAIERYLFGEGVVATLEHLLAVFTQHRPATLFPRMIGRAGIPGIPRHLLALVVRDHPGTIRKIYELAMADITAPDATSA